MKRMQRKTGFTLIELLVVIAIIALLMAVIMPALSVAKMKAQAIVCLANLNGLSKCWTLYAEENNDEIVGGLTAATTEPYYSWVEVPQDDDGNSTVGSNTTEEEINGIQDGLLFSYVNNPKSYHCPGDKRYLKPAVASGITAMGGYRSYSIVGGARGGSWSTANQRYEVAGVVAHTKSTTFKSPGDKYVFVEEMDGRGYNRGSWLINPSTPNSWIDPIAIWHKDTSTFGFADGHGEKHKWLQDEVIEMAEQQTFYLTAPGDDTEWMQRNYPYLKLL